MQVLILSLSLYFLIFLTFSFGKLRERDLSQFLKKIEITLSINKTLKMSYILLTKSNFFFGDGSQLIRTQEPTL